MSHCRPVWSTATVYPALFAHTISLHEVTDHAAYLYPVAGVPYVLGVNEDAWDRSLGCRTCCGI